MATKKRRARGQAAEPAEPLKLNSTEVWDVASRLAAQMLAAAKKSVSLRERDVKDFDKKLANLRDLVASDQGSKSAEKSLRRLEKRREGQEKDLLSLRAHLDDVKGLADALATLRKDNKERDKLHTEAMKQIAELTQSNRELRVETDEACAERDEFEEETLRLAETIDGLNKQVKELQRALQKADTSAKRAGDQAAELGTKASELKAQLKEASAERDRHKGRAERFREEIAVLREDLETREEELGTAQKDYEDALAHAMELQKVIDVLSDVESERDSSDEFETTPDTGAGDSFDVDMDSDDVDMASDDVDMDSDDVDMDSDDVDMASDDVDMASDDVDMASDDVDMASDDVDVDIDSEQGDVMLAPSAVTTEPETTDPLVDDLTVVEEEGEPPAIGVVEAAEDEADLELGFEDVDFSEEPVANPARADELPPPEPPPWDATAPVAQAEPPAPVTSPPDDTGSNHGIDEHVLEDVEEADERSAEIISETFFSGDPITPFGGPKHRVAGDPKDFTFTVPPPDTDGVGENPPDDSDSGFAELADQVATDDFDAFVDAPQTGEEPAEDIGDALYSLTEPSEDDQPEAPAGAKSGDEGGDRVQLPGGGEDIDFDTAYEDEDLDPPLAGNPMVHARPSLAKHQYKTREAVRLAGILHHNDYRLEELIRLSSLEEKTVRRTVGIFHALDLVELITLPG